jgi:hypothetical protein
MSFLNMKVPPALDIGRSLARTEFVVTGGLLRHYFIDRAKRQTEEGPTDSSVVRCSGGGTVDAVKPALQAGEASG